MGYYPVYWNGPHSRLLQLLVYYIYARKNVALEDVIDIESEEISTMSTSLEDRSRKGGKLMRLIHYKTMYVSLLLILAPLIGGCSWMGGSNPSSAPHISTYASSSTIHGVEADLLTNIKDNGFDNASGSDGLWINWRYGTQPLQTNINGTGEPDGVDVNPPRHDELTDLRYIHNLWSYKQQNPSDTSFDGEIARYTPIIKYEFANSHNERGWLYDEFIAIYQLTHDVFYKNTAISLASSYAKRYDSRVGSIYKLASDHPYGSYRVDMVLEEGCALLQAGASFEHPEWQQMGANIINFVYSHAYINQYHTFADQMDNVLLPDGSVNPHEQFYVGRTKNYTVNGHLSQMGEISQIIISLLDTYNTTHKQDFLNKATRLLDSYALPANPLGMWDTVHNGYFFAAEFRGPTPEQPGPVFVNKKVKEAGRQMIMLQAFHLADTLTNNRYKMMEDQMLRVALKDTYYAPGHGVLYEVHADWAPLTFHNGELNNAVTTEAMGAELESLFALGT